MKSFCLVRMAAAISIGAVLTALATVALTLPATVSAQVPPQGGLWDLSVSMEGAPSGTGLRKSQVCLHADALHSSPEQTLIEAASKADGEARGRLSCEVRDTNRGGSSSTWQALCDGPRGKMQGNGSGNWTASTAELQQSFSIKAPIGTITLKQVISARRLGACQ